MIVTIKRLRIILSGFVVAVSSTSLIASVFYGLNWLYPAVIVLMFSLLTVGLALTILDAKKKAHLSQGSTK